MIEKGDAGVAATNAVAVSVSASFGGDWAELLVLVNSVAALIYTVIRIRTALRARNAKSRSHRDDA